MLSAAVAAVVVLVLLGAGAAAVVASRRSSEGGNANAASGFSGRTVSISCPSPAMGGSLPAQVYLPSGYSVRGRRDPVIYFLHGLPAGPGSYKTNAFVAAGVARTGERAIVVAPQGARQPGSDREYLDWSPTENWPRAIAHDLPTCIDSRYHTVADRHGRALMGLSAGGYGAANIGLRNLSTFAVVQAWSGYFVATDPSGDHVLRFESAQDARVATVPDGPWLRAEDETWPAQIAFYVGAQDSRFLQMNRQFAAALTKSGIAHTFRTYPGGHSAALWIAQAPHWLGMALGYLMKGQSQRR